MNQTVKRHPLMKGTAGVQQKKLTGWKQEPTLLDLKTDFEQARPAQQAQNTKD